MGAMNERVRIKGIIRILACVLMFTILFLSTSEYAYATEGTGEIGGTGGEGTGYSLTLKANYTGGADGYESSVTEFKLPELTRSGYVHSCWCTKESESAEGAEIYEIGSTIQLTSNLTLFAIWGEVTVNNIDYIDLYGNSQTCQICTITNKDTSEMSSGWYVVVGTIQSDYRISMNGNVNLILCDGAELSCNGIEVSSENSLSIYGQSNGTGKLVASTGDYRAGIGGSAGGVGNITINGGTVTASSISGAGIGGCGSEAGGNITINGGTVTASSISGAGIGGCGSGGNITINGGTVTASSEKGAGIGGGYYGEGGNITINGGTVTANGVGIGCGYEGAGGTITLGLDDYASITSNGYNGMVTVRGDKYLKIKGTDSPVYFGTLTDNQISEISGKTLVTTSASDMETVVAPTFKPVGGTYNSAQSVTISCTTNNADIYYTEDGSAPTTSSTQYSGPFTVSETTTIKAIAVKNGMNNSAVSTATYSIREDIDTATVTGIIDKTYTGKAITQSPTVTLGGKVLTKDTDYTITYANNTDAGTATITITGTGNYKGSLSNTFKIDKADQTITASDITKTTADAVFSIGAKTSGDGQLSYASSNASVVTVDGSGNVTIKGAGNTTITITAAETANHKQATKTINVTVTAPVQKSIATATVTGITDKTYTGKAITQFPTVVLDNKTLLNGTDYTLSYANNVNVGTTTMTITGTGSYTGSLQKTFAIAQAGQTITASDITKTTADAAFSIGASTSGDGQLSYASSSASVVTVDGSGNATAKGAGNATITITAAETSNYKSATKTINVTVMAPAPVLKSIATASVSGIKSKTYTGKAITQNPTVTLEEKTLQKGTDYTLSYENNVNAGTATVTITGIGAYTGSINKTFAIAKANQTITASDITKTTTDAAFNIGAKASGKLSYKSGNTKVVTVDENGKVTIKGAGSTTITITASATANYNKATKTVNVTVTSKSSTKKSIAKAAITGLKTKAYTGKAITQSLTVKLGSTKLKAGTDYTASYKNNKNVGTATITITGKGSYKGTVTATFKIKKAANSLKVKAKKTAYNITYSKLAKKDQVIKETQIYNVTKKGQGKLSYALVSAKTGKKSIKKSFSVDKKTGKLTIKKRMKKGTYSVEINVTAAGDKTHNKVSKKISVSVKVK